MKLGVSEAAKWGDRLVSGAPQPLNGLLRERSGVMVGEKGGRGHHNHHWKWFFFAQFCCEEGWSYPQDGHWEVGNLLKWIRKSGNVMGNLVNWMRKSYCAVFGGADGWRSNTFDGELENILLGTGQNNLKFKMLQSLKIEPTQNHFLSKLGGQ